MTPTEHVARMTEGIDDAIHTLLTKLAASDSMRDTVILLRGDHGIQADTFVVVIGIVIGIAIGMVISMVICMVISDPLVTMHADDDASPSSWQ